MFVELFPFSNDKVKTSLCSKKFVFSNVEKNCFLHRAIITFYENGIVDGLPVESFWEIDGGVLSLKDNKRKTSFSFDMLKVINNSVFLYGRDHENKNNWVSLYPQLSLADSGKKVKYVISTHVTYWDITKRRLIRSLSRAGINNDDLLVVIAGGDEIKEYKEKGIEYIQTTHNSWEYTALIELGRRKRTDADWWFLLHDTCEADTNFEDMVSKFDIGMNYDVVYGVPTPVLGQFNIGLYNIDFLIRESDFFSGLKDITKAEGIKVELDRGHLGIKSKALLVSVVNGLNASRTRITENRDVYGNGVERQVYYLTACGLYKYLANAHAVEKGTWVISP